MRLLLDTNALIWALGDFERLSRPAATALSDLENTVFVSAASAWEIATKHRIGKLPGVEKLVADFDAALHGRDFEQLAISVRHGRLAGALVGQHKDPFDRMIAAQSMLESALVVSSDRKLDQFGVQRLW